MSRGTLALLLLGFPQVVCGQSQDATGILSGIVVAEEGGEPLEEASVLLPDIEKTTSTDKSGQFTFAPLTPGVLTIQVHRIGHALSEGTVEVRGGETTEIRVVLSTEAVSLDPIVVTARRRFPELPDIDGFERRYRSGWGRFILEDDIRMRNPIRLTDVLRETGLEVTGNGTSLLSRRRNCAPAVYLNGLRISPRLTGPGTNPGVEAAEAANLMTPSLVRAVEVYRSYAETPGRFADRHARCGVVLIWTE